MAKPVEVFVSFRVSETDAEARLLKSALEAMGVRTFVSSVDIEQGQVWRRVIAKSLGEAKLLVALGSLTYGAQGTSSQGTLEELAVAKEYDKKIFVFQMCDKYAEIEAAMELRGLNCMRWAIAAPMPETAWAALVKSMAHAGVPVREDIERPALLGPNSSAAHAVRAAVAAQASASASKAADQLAEEMAERAVLAARPQSARPQAPPSSSQRFPGCVQLLFPEHGSLLQAGTNFEALAGGEGGCASLAHTMWQLFRVGTKLAFKNMGNDRWLCAESDGSVVCNRTRQDVWETWGVTKGSGPGTYTLRSYHGPYLACEATGRVTASRAVAAQWALQGPQGGALDSQAADILDQVLAVQSMKGCVRLYSAEHRTLLQAEGPGGGYAVSHATAENADPAAATWHLHSAAGGKLAFCNVGSGRWLCAEPGGRVVADRAQQDVYEAWGAERGILNGSPTIALKSFHGPYLCCEPGGRVVADRAVAAQWEQFVLQGPQGGAVDDDVAAIMRSI